MIEVKSAFEDDDLPLISLRPLHTPFAPLLFSPANRAPEQGRVRATARNFNNNRAWPFSMAISRYANGEEREREREREREPCPTKMEWMLKNRFTRMKRNSVTNSFRCKCGRLVASVPSLFRKVSFNYDFLRVPLVIFHPRLKDVLPYVRIFFKFESFNSINFARVNESIK